MKEKTRNEARAIAGGLYSWNAPYAAVYAFTEAEGGGVNIGEFLSASEIEERLNFDHYDGYVDKTNGSVHTLRPGCRCVWENGRLVQRKVSRE